MDVLPGESTISHEKGQPDAYEENACHQKRRGAKRGLAYKNGKSHANQHAVPDPQPSHRGRIKHLPEASTSCRGWWLSESDGVCKDQHDRSDSACVGPAG